MKKTLTVLTIGFLLTGALGCSTTPKQEEAAPETTISESVEPQEEIPLEETSSAETPETSTSSSTSDLSLGAGSSGRGH